MRYSVGDWQSTATSCSATIARRSSGSKRASWSRHAAPAVHGATNALRADLDHPLAAVHHEQLARARAQPVLCLHRLAAQVRLGVHDAARLARRAGREDQQRRVGRRGVGDIDAGARRGQPVGIDVDQTRRVLRISHRALELGHVGARGEHEGRSGALHPEGDVLGAAAAPSRAATTAPRRHAPSIAKTHSGRAPIRVITTLPRPTPACASPAAVSAACRATSAYE